MNHKIGSHCIRVIARIVVESQIANVVACLFKRAAQQPIDGRDTAQKTKTVLGDNNIFNLHRILPFNQRTVEVSE